MELDGTRNDFPEGREEKEVLKNVEWKGENNGRLPAI